MKKQDEATDDLSALPNIGCVAARRLVAVGIDTPAKLRRIGSVAAAGRLAEGPGANPPCRSMLSALEGAIRGIRWHAIPKDQREALWREYQLRTRRPV